MKEVYAVVHGVKRRVLANLVLEHLFEFAFYAAAALALVLLAIKIIFFPNALTWFGYACLVAAAATVLYAAIASRVAFFQAAVEADEGLRVAERFSSAILVARDPAPMAMAVVADARRFAKRVNLKRQFPVTLPDRWWRLAAATAVLAAVLVMPQLDLFGRQAAFVKKQKEKEQVAKEVKELRKKVETAKKALEGKDFEGMQELDNLNAKLVDMEKMGLTKKEALAQVSDTMEKLADKMKQSARDLAKNADAAKLELSKALADQLKAADEKQKALETAKAELADMMKKMEQGNLSKEDAKKLAEALQKMAEKMPNGSQSAQAMQQAAQALQSGNQSAASQSMQQALSDMQTQMAGLQSQMGLLQQQMAALQPNSPNAPNQQGMTPGMQGQMMAGQPDAAQQIADMTSALNGMSAFKENATGTESLSMADAMAQLQQAAAMAGNSQGGGNIPGSGGVSDTGMGGPGRGRGGSWPVGAETGVNPEASNVAGDMKQGRMLAAYMTKGGQIKNESRVQYQEVILESKQRAKDALTEQKVPRTYQGVVREYFDSLEAPPAK